MDIDWDPAKDAINRAKHGLALAQAGELEWDLLLCAPDSRRDYGELREVGFAPLGIGPGARVHCVVFVQRGTTYRIVSLRRANLREASHYDQALEEFRLHPPHG